jgi:hypothetical protein
MDHRPRERNLIALRGAVDGAGDLAIADSSNNRVRVVAVKSGTFYGVAVTAGDICTIAGNGNYGYSGNGAEQGDLHAWSGLMLAQICQRRVGIVMRRTPKLLLKRH